MPFDINNPKKPTKEEVVSKIKESGCDAVFIASLLKRRQDEIHRGKNCLYTYDQLVPQPGITHAYYSGTYNTVSTPSYYTQDKVHILCKATYMMRPLKKKKCGRLIQCFKSF